MGLTKALACATIAKNQERECIRMTMHIRLQKQYGTKYAPGIMTR